MRVTEVGEVEPARKLNAWKNDKHTDTAERQMPKCNNRV